MGWLVFRSCTSEFWAAAGTMAKTKRSEARMIPPIRVHFTSRDLLSPCRDSVPRREPITLRGRGTSDNESPGPSAESDDPGPASGAQGPAAYDSRLARRPGLTPAASLHSGD